jgi:glutamate carboxypeptidase
MIAAAMDQYLPYLQWIDSQHKRMVSLVTHWAGINSGTHHIGGLYNLANVLQLDFATLGASEMQRLELPPQRVIDSRGNVAERPLGNLLTFRKRPEAKMRVLLGIHYDTVYGGDSSFQSVKVLDKQRLNGPGVADAKGGIAVLLIALECLERFIADQNSQAGVPDLLGWEVFLNPDEEIGSVSSGRFLAEMALRNHAGLVFEPALPDGALVGERKGSGNFVAVMRGRAAHAGRDPAAGRNAIEALAEYVLELRELARSIAGVTINVGQIEGGSTTNIVPDLAIARFNVRYGTAEEQVALELGLKGLTLKFNEREGYAMELHGGITAPPKRADEGMKKLMDLTNECGAELGLNLLWRATGGVCDGNRLAAAGLPTVDTLGPRGGELHSPNEFLVLDSLTERAKLVGLMLMRMQELVPPVICDFHSLRDFMARYANLSGNSGIETCKIGDDSIIVGFKGNQRYLYNYWKPGRAHVEEMKKLAEAGRGLSTYIAKYVKDNYAAKLS